jgi:hypothetical protein
MEGNIDLKSDVSAEDYEKREYLDKIWPKMSMIFWFWMGKIPFFWLIQKAKKVIYGWIMAVTCDSFFFADQRGKGGCYGMET